MTLARALARTTAAVVAAVAAGALLTTGAAAAPIETDKGVARGEGPVAAAAAVDSGLVATGTRLAAGAAVVSSDGRDRFVMQTDGNLVLYSDRRAVWQSRTYGNPGARAEFQTDGNLVVYSTAGRVLWHSQTYGVPDADLMVGHGDVVVANPEGTGRVWQAKTGRDRLRPGQTLTGGQSISENPLFWYGDAGVSPLTRLVMQTDGNLVLYSYEGPVLWHAGTFRNPGARLVMQTDGNLVVYSATGRALWHSNTRGTGNHAHVGGVVRDLVVDGQRIPVFAAADHLVVVTPADRMLTSRPV